MSEYIMPTKKTITMNIEVYENLKAENKALHEIGNKLADQLDAYRKLYTDLVLGLEQED